MKIHIPTNLTDDQLLSALQRFAASEKQSTAQVVAHLAELDTRGLHTGLGFSSLFKYGCEVLHLSEHETYNRVEAARLARRFPLILDLLGGGDVNLTTLRLLGAHLTEDNHRELLAAATHRSKREVEELVARIAPRPDVPSSVRKLPVRRESSAPPLPVAAEAAAPSAPLLFASAPASPTLAPPPRPAPRRPVVAPLAPDRYQVTFTVSGETRDKLRRAQDLLRHAIPAGDTAEIFDRALDLLLADVTRKKCAATSKPGQARAVAPHSRHVPAEVTRAAYRDGERCSFVGKDGRPCGERAFLELHHVKPYGASGEATAANIVLLCAPHNRYESELFYSARRSADGSSVVKEPAGQSGNSVWT